MLQHICNTNIVGPSLQVVITIIANNNIYYIRCMQLYTSQNYLPHWNNLVLVAYYTNYIILVMVIISVLINHI